MNAPSDDAASVTASPSSHGRRLLSRRMTWICVGASILVFAVWEGPSWRHADNADAAALWSYAVIPPLVAGALMFERRLALLPLLAATVEVTAWKFFATYLFAQTMWMIFPPVSAPRPLPVVSAEPRAPDPPPTAIDPGRTGGIDGRVTAHGAPVKDALVYIDSGLERYVFAPPPDVIRIASEGGRMVTAAEVAEVGQRVEARSGDGKLHTLIASTSDGDAFSIPLQSSGAWSQAKLRAATGVATLHCGVHQRSDETRRLVITSNPFWTKTDEHGDFRLSKIPAERIHLSALATGAGAAGTEATVEAGKSVHVVVSF